MLLINCGSEIHISSLYPIFWLQIHGSIYLPDNLPKCPYISIFNILNGVSSSPLPIHVQICVQIVKFLPLLLRSLCYYQLTFWINSFFFARAPGADLNSYNHSLYESIIVFLVLPNGSLSFCCLSVWEILAPLTRSPFSRPPPNFIVCSDSHSYSKQQPLYSWVLSLSSFSVLLVE